MPAGVTEEVVVPALAVEGVEDRIRGMGLAGAADEEHAADAGRGVGVNLLSVGSVPGPVSIEDAAAGYSSRNARVDEVGVVVIGADEDGGRRRCRPTVKINAQFAGLKILDQDRPALRIDEQGILFAGVMQEGVEVVPVGALVGLADEKIAAVENSAVELNLPQSIGIEDGVEAVAGGVAIGVGTLAAF